LYRIILIVLFFRTLFIFCCLSSLIFCQIQNDSLSFNKSPKKAALSALVFPGGGQLYNGKKLKAGLIISMEVYSILNWYTNSFLYNNYDEQNNSKYPLPKYRYLEKRNKYVWWIGFVYIYGLIDAIVDAHLQPFDNIMEEDIYLDQSSIKRKENK